MNDLLHEVVVTGSEDGPELPIIAGEGRAWAAVWPGMGARLRSMHRISLPPGGRTIELTHVSDAVYYVMSGGGDVVDCEAGQSHPLVSGSMVHVDVGTPYELTAGEDGIELVGGPSPPDRSLYPAPARAKEDPL